MSYYEQMYYEPPRPQPRAEFVQELPDSYDIAESSEYPEEGWDDTGIITKGNLDFIPLSLEKNNRSMTRQMSRSKYFLIHDKETDMFYQPIVFLMGFNLVVQADNNKPIKSNAILYDVIENQMVDLGTLSDIKSNSVGSSSIIQNGRVLGDVKNKVLYINQKDSVSGGRKSSKRKSSKRKGSKRKSSKRKYRR